MDKKYVAYVSSYTKKNKNGITIYDVDLEKGVFTEKGEVAITNSSYLTRSHNHKYLYSITDLGVTGFRILEDGMLEEINCASINGMRGCYLSTDYEDRFIFVAGYHDGKITVLRLEENGIIDEITDEIYVQGMGEVTDRSFVPHVSCVKMSRDNKYLFASDTGMDHVNVYSLNHESGKLKLVDIIRCNVDSGPRHMIFSRDNKYLYVLQEIMNSIDVYTYKDNGDYPEFELIQTAKCLPEHSSKSLSSALKFSKKQNYIVSSNSGDNSVALFKRDEETGLLERIMCLPISGSYPKDACLFPDLRHLVSLNNESDTLTFFDVDTDKGTIAMCSKEMKIEKPNCIIFFEISRNYD